MEYYALQQRQYGVCSCETKGKVNTTEYVSKFVEYAKL